MIHYRPDGRPFPTWLNLKDVAEFVACMGIYEHPDRVVGRFADQIQRVKVGKHYIYNIDDVHKYMLRLRQDPD